MSEPVADDWDGELYAAAMPVPELARLHPEVYVALARAVGDPILELATGTGRLLLALLEAGIDAVGLDRSPSMVAEAQRGLQRAGIPEAEQRVCVGDMRTFRLGRRFRAIMLPDNSLATLLEDEDVQRTLSRVRAHLEEEGDFLFDLTLFEDAPSRVDFAARAIELGGEACRLHMHGDYDRKSESFSLHLACEGPTQTRSMKICLRARSVARMDALLRSAGFVARPGIVDEQGRVPGRGSRLAFGRYALTRT